MKRLMLIACCAALAACDTIDFSSGRPYACTPGAGGAQCPGGWHCGASGICQNPNVIAPYYCLSDSDCEGGWHCGAQSFCYDALDAGAVACRVDAGDCAPGWRCGLNQTCHDQDAGAPYPCASDSDCEQGWRCGPDQRCVDARAEGLGPAQLSLSRLVVRPLNAINALPQAVLGASPFPIELTFWTGGDRRSTDALRANTLVTGRPSSALVECAPIKGDPLWAILCPNPQQGDFNIKPFVTWWNGDGGGGPTPALAGLQASSTVGVDFSSPTEPAHGWTAPTAGGGRELLVALQDRLWGTDVTTIPPTPYTPAIDGGLPLQLVPLPGAAIDAFTATTANPDAGANFLHAFLLAQERLFEIAAPSPSRWSATELALPSGAPLDLWSDSQLRARVGFQDGTVFSLPSRVPIATPLNGDSILSYATLCSDELAMGGQGLYRLEQQSGVVGRWAPVTLPFSAAWTDAGTWSTARVLSTGRELFFFPPQGTPYWVQVDGGCP